MLAVWPRKFDHDSVNRESSWWCQLTRWLSKPQSSVQPVTKILVIILIYLYSNDIGYSANYIVPGGTGVCHEGKIRCHHWRQSWHHGNSWFFSEYTEHKNTCTFVADVFKWFLLTHWDLNEMAATLQTTSWNAFSLMKNILVRFKFQCNLFTVFSMATTHIQVLALEPNRWQAII